MAPGGRSNFMPELGWREAIVQVLKGHSEPMHYAAIAEAIADQGLRTEFGATPAASVNSIISVSIQNEAEKSPFLRVGRGLYALRETSPSQLQPPTSPIAEADDTGL